MKLLIVQAISSFKNMVTKICWADSWCRKAFPKMHYLHAPLHCGTTQESHKLYMECLRIWECFLLKQRKIIGLHIYCAQGNLVSSALLSYPSFWVDWEIRQENKADKHQNSSLIIDELDILYFWSWTSVFFFLFTNVSIQKYWLGNFCSGRNETEGVLP